MITFYQGDRIENKCKYKCRNKCYQYIGSMYTGNTDQCRSTPSPGGSINETSTAPRAASWVSDCREAQARGNVAPAKAADKYVQRGTWGIKYVVWLDSRWWGVKCNTDLGRWGKERQQTLLLTPTTFGVYQQGLTWRRVTSKGEPW